MSEQATVVELEDEGITLDYETVKAVVTELLGHLEFKHMPKIVRPDFVTRMFDLVEHIEDYVNSLSYVKRANKEKAIRVKRIAGILTDIVEGVNNIDLSRNDFPDIHKNLKEALAAIASDYETDTSTLVKFDSSTLFALASDQAIADLKFFKSKRKSKKKSKVHRKMKADILLHCSPTISDADAARVGLKFRIVDGYVHIKDQRILMIDSIQTDDAYQHARSVARAGGNEYVPMENIYYAKGGLAYAWFVKPDVITNLFSQIEINAWCCVRNET